LWSKCNLVAANVTTACTNNIAESKPASGYLQPDLYAQPGVPHSFVAFLRDLALDDEIDVETGRGAPARYRVREVTVVDKGETRVLDDANASLLTLITCFPFDAVLPGTRMRYVVIAERVT
jgi:hypothetical protein